jgi:hypothetical protein
MLSGALLSLLLLLNLMVLQMGFSGWAKTDTQADILQALQVAGGRWVREIMSATPNGLSTEASAMAILSARDDEQGEQTRGPYARLLWRRFRVYYQKPVEQELWVRNVDPAAPLKEAQRIESLNLGSGLQSLTFYCTAGRRLAQDVSECRFEVNGDVWRWRVVGQRRRYGREAAEKVEVTFSAQPRN